MTIKRKLIERIRVTGPMTEMNKATDFCNRNGFLMRAGGPAHIRGTMRYDKTRFAFTAEREVVKV